jgi:tRNA nucleotidyltransferase (CCA-adding enzyme)
MMKIYRVGGSVRDALLGLAVKDIDYVVVGSTPEQMIAAGYTPVGKDFPVFLHPHTKAEYALARTERKSAPGYHGFVFHCAPEVSIEEDLRRRDLTINAMAIAEEENQQHIIDPFGGQNDLANQVFRHVSEAFVEDPVRILRVARFAARFPTFTVAPETLQLMRHMVQNGEVNALVPERVWQEIARGLMEQQPSRMVDVLRESNALPFIFPELEAALADSETQERRMKQAVDYAAQLNSLLAVRWATLLAAAMTNTNEALTAIHQLCTRLKVPAEVLALARLTLQEQTNVEQALSLSPESTLSLLERCDAFRRPARLIQLIEAVRCIHQSTAFEQQNYLEQALTAAQNVATGEIAKAVMERFPNQPHKIAAAISAARVEAIKLISK